MATVLDEILAESTPKQVSIGNKYGVLHSPACNCIYCRSTGYRSTGSHKYWRQRRAERLCAPQKMPAGSGRGIPVQ